MIAIQSSARYLVRRGGPADMRKALFATTNLTRIYRCDAYAELMKSDERRVSRFYIGIYFSTSDAICGSRRVYREPTHPRSSTTGKSAVS